ncbi:phosphotransferase family protein [Vibrio owensii]|uniref:phosphotransferase family protein n=1 Tax=Vibrio owensii TaxID=696485 RepID=UPI004069492C
MPRKELSQMGSAQVFLTEKEGLKVIEKRNPTQVEVAFYQNQSAKFNQQGILVPEFIGFDAEQNTLWIEYIPHPVDQAFLLQDPRVLRRLAQIHQTPQPTNNAIFKSHTWTDEATTSAFETLHLDAQTEARLRRLQTQAKCLFKPQTLLSGDSNAGNWGLRDNGDLVLFDWERFSTGHPAIDLSPLVAGMGTMEDYKQIAKQYIAMGGKGIESEITTAVLLAKAWIVIEVTNLLVSRNNPQASKYIEWFRQTLPKWCKSVSLEAGLAER